MKSCKLSFATIFAVQNNLAELIVNEGIEIDEIKVDELHDALLNSFETPISLLINKRHSFSYTFQAQIKITQLKELKAIAIVIGTNGALMSTQTLMSVNKNVFDDIELFQEREEALTWLGESN
ncbi:hypothetical protein [Flavivirga eckloniae]|uniref:STAS/SEC14 domain-containing protein n=1 Tax=Flavivirga eckloniae TaxID=1803846 RepID=A0A2K9PTQ6_9FLAO|nr:hypothetical protein [Flavivirga eckloniae]AUP80445.1 hypothetical protein C1H87_17690 [Flavivirga eckloniae]